MNVKMRRKRVCNPAQVEFQRLLSDRFMVVLRHHPMTMQSVALEVGVSLPTMHRFSSCSSPTKLMQLKMVEKWVVEQESKFGISFK